jgi:hypothetical protein
MIQNISNVDIGEHQEFEKELNGSLREGSYTEEEIEIDDSNISEE